MPRDLTITITDVPDSVTNAELAEHIGRYWFGDASLTPAQLLARVSEKLRGELKHAFILGKKQGLAENVAEPDFGGSQ